jgi:hypothetical protein
MVRLVVFEADATTAKLGSLPVGPDLRRRRGCRAFRAYIGEGRLASRSAFPVINAPTTKIRVAR